MHAAGSASLAEKVVVVHKTSRLQFQRMKHSDLSEEEVAHMVREDVKTTIDSLAALPSLSHAHTASRGWCGL